MKTCSKCKISKEQSEFHADKRKKDGLYTHCKECHREYQKENWRNPETKAVKIAYDKEKRQTKDYKNKHAEYMRGYKKLHREKYNIWNKQYQLNKLNRTPKWLCGDEIWMMEEAYELAVMRTNMFKFQWHVDHIIPLKGKTVSGLHTPYNLQVIPATLNQRKSNSYGA